MANKLAHKGCRKVKFRTEDDAIFSIKKIKGTSERKTLPVRAYLCGFCGAWHLTSKPSINELCEENARLCQEVAQLRQDLNAQVQVESKEDRIKIRADERLVEQRKLFKKLKDEFKRQRRDQRALMTKNILLEEKLKQMEQKI